MDPLDYYSIQSQLALPYLPTPPEVVEEVISFLQEFFQQERRMPQQAMDLGAGDGRVVFALATAFPECEVKGIEINEELSNAGQQLVAELPNAQIIRGDLFQADLASADLVFIFALPTMMASLRHVLLPLQTDAIIVAFRYPLAIPDYEMELLHEGKTEVGAQIYTFFVYCRENF